MKLPGKRSYPKEIRFGGESYEIRWVRKFEDERPDESTLGECCPTEKVITLRLGESKHDTFVTFLHEVLHLVEFEAPIKMRHSHIYKLSEALAKIFIENF